MNKTLNLVITIKHICFGKILFWLFAKQSQNGWKEDRVFKETLWKGSKVFPTLKTGFYGRDT